MLKGIRILDLTRVLAGPYGSMLLADLGAEIIKIEPPGGDDTRQMTQVVLKETSGYFLSVNRNKKSVVIDLTQASGKHLFYELVEKADVVLDNFRTGILEKLGIDYETLKKYNPSIICCSISGYGHTGPRKDRPSFDLVLQAEGGAMSITGEPGRPPVRMGLPMGDLAGGLFGAMAISAALVSRDRTGQGQKIDLSLLDCQASLLTYVGQYYLLNGQIPQPIGSGHQNIVPYQAFRTSDGWIVIACFSNKFWPILCRVIDLIGLAEDPQFVNPSQRLTNKETLIPILENKLAEKTSAEWLKLLDEAGVPAGPVNTVNQVLADPQVLDRGMVVEMEDAELGNYRMLGNPVKTTALQEQIFTTAPGLGEHTGEVLGELLCYDNERIKRLAQAGIITLGRPNGAQ